jgi:hypothetical protein
MPFTDFSCLSASIAANAQRCPGCRKVCIDEIRAVLARFWRACPPGHVCYRGQGYAEWHTRELIQMLSPNDTKGEMAACEAIYFVVNT